MSQYLTELDEKIEAIDDEIKQKEKTVAEMLDKVNTIERELDLLYKEHEELVTEFTEYNNAIENRDRS